MRFPIDTYSDNLMLPVETMQRNGLAPQMIQRIVRLRDIYNYMLRWAGLFSQTQLRTLNELLNF